MSVLRTAIVSGGLNATLTDVRDYLPQNYSAWEYREVVWINGRDNHGWTLDGYVLPRLGSALIAAEEVMPCDDCEGTGGHETYNSGHDRPPGECGYCHGYGYHVWTGNGWRRKVKA